MDTNTNIEDQFTARVKLYLGNCLDVLKTMESDSVDSIVTDPPAGISFMNKHWDTDHGHRDQWIAYFAEIAKECLRVIKPGGHALVWAIPRTSHWTATAWENGGWEVRDRIIYCFGSGFPKSHNISKAIDKLAGAEREVLLVNKDINRYPNGPGGVGFHGGVGEYQQTIRPPTPLTAPATDAAKQWDGWGTALKPAVEDWWLLRKPLSEDTIAENVLEHGTGAINVDGCRVGTETLVNAGMSSLGVMHDDKWEPRDVKNTVTGRWPANMIYDGSEEVTELFPDTGGSTYKAPNARLRKEHKLVESNGTSNAPDSYGDSGSAARFFYCAKASKADRDEWCEGMEARNNMRVNAPRDSEKENHRTRLGNNHPTVKPTALMRYLCRLITPPDGIVLDPFMGSGSTGKACMLEGFRFIGIEMEEEYVVVARARIIHALKPEVQEYYKKKQSKSGKVKEATNEKADEEGDLS